LTSHLAPSKKPTSCSSRYGLGLPRLSREYICHSSTNPGSAPSRRRTSSKNVGLSVRSGAAASKRCRIEAPGSLHRWAISQRGSTHDGVWLSASLVSYPMVGDPSGEVPLVTLTMGAPGSPVAVTVCALVLAHLSPREAALCDSL
jgi:hypothetical protein